MLKQLFLSFILHTVMDINHLMTEELGQRIAGERVDDQSIVELQTVYYFSTDTLYVISSVPFRFKGK